MRIKTYSGGQYIKACNTITYWVVNGNVFIELYSQGLKYLVYDSLQSFHEDKPIFEIYHEPEIYFPNTEDQNQLEEDRVFDEIRKFLISHVGKKEAKQWEM